MTRQDIDWIRLLIGRFMAIHDFTKDSAPDQTMQIVANCRRIAAEASDQFAETQSEKDIPY